MTTSTPARRTYASLKAERSFTEVWGITGRVLSIAPMGLPTYWRHVDGTGKWNSKDALYEEVGL